MRKEDLQIGMALSLKRVFVLDAPGVCFRQPMRALLPAFLLGAQVHIGLVVPEAHQFHWKVQSLGDVAQVCDNLAGAEIAPGFDVDDYPIHNRLVKPVRILRDCSIF